MPRPFLAGFSAALLLAASVCAGADDPWRQIAKLNSGDGVARSGSGLSVALDGEFALVGSLSAFEYDPGGGPESSHRSGTAYVYGVATGEKHVKLTPDEVGRDSEFGYSVALDGGVALVGAPGDVVDGSYGSAFLFDVATGTQFARLTPDDGSGHESFARSVALGGGYALVGDLIDDANGVRSGAAYLFDAATGAQLAKLTPDDGVEGDLFGSSLAIDGEIAVIGAIGDDDRSGSAYLFDLSTGAQLAKFVAPDGRRYDQFGGSVAIDGGVALVGAVGDDDNGSYSGSVYAFDTATGGLISKLVADDGDSANFFGESVGLDKEIAIIGAHTHDSNGLPYSGAAYLFDWATGQQLAKLTASDATPLYIFGASVEVEGGIALVGAPGDADNGAFLDTAYLFDISRLRVPEPATAALIAVGLCSGVAWRGRSPRR